MRILFLTSLHIEGKNNVLPTFFVASLWEPLKVPDCSSIVDAACSTIYNNIDVNLLIQKNFDQFKIIYQTSDGNFLGNTAMKKAGPINSRVKMGHPNHQAPT